jgi:hypothetical protein
MDNEHFPHVGTNTRELYGRDVDFINYHINHDKWMIMLQDFDIINAHRLCLDFDSFAAGDWVITTVEAGGGSAAEMLLDFINGVLLVGNDSAKADSDELVWAVKTFCIAKSYPLYWEMRLKITDVDLANAWAGLVDSTTGYYDGSVSNGCYFLLSGGVLYACVESAGTVVAEEVDLVPEDLTWIRLGIHWDGESMVRFFVFTDQDACQPCSAQVYASAGYPVVDTILLAPGFGIQNVNAQAEALYIDYSKCVQRRAIGPDTVDEANGRQ